MVTGAPRVEVDAIVVGSGPNGLATAVTLARAGLSVHVVEREATIGGGARTEELTLPGFRHDVCSAVHPLALASRFFREFGLDRRIELVVPEVSFGHPLDGGRAGIAWRDFDRTVDGLGADGAAYRSLLARFVAHPGAVASFTGGSIVRIPADPVTAVRFGLNALEQGTRAWSGRFTDVPAPAMLTGAAAHAILPLPSVAAAAVGLSLVTWAHTVGWPVPVGGSQAIVDALVADLTAHGGTIETGRSVERLDELPAARAVLFDTTPRALASIAGERMPRRYLETLERFRYGNAVAKVDFALSGPVPWTNPDLARTGTLHLGGTREELAVAENAVARGIHPDSPYVLVSQPTVLDPARAPEGKHVLWAYTHVPRGSNLDRTEVVTRQIERFAPGFRDLVLASASRTAIDVEAHNPNYVLGDISAGEPDFAQLLRRPVLSPDPWRTPARGIYLCSASTPPGPGVHGLGGWHAARSALRHEFGITAAPSLAP
ncbi:NAD(P)/FAD-dependent oxidoreductase [Agromyces protaetiae]|uniref:NAD(P)/FAD-dependent oxidoreductase n=1 Tax=Agromyces protaetiae TaxID=2509455 RepID=A0A4P6FAN1_9MICO|nr:NAD(P)/FAD-dependent oxidoreductase [Agromyces protaetiae]QAY73022.1 NAD(P)/FAD-dependent oxidoreductase [Agromyces protaetiae]